MWCHQLLLLCCLGVVTAGCSSEQAPRSDADKSPEVALAQLAENAAGQAFEELGKADAPLPAKAVQHKIIRTAELHLVVEDFSAVSTKITQLTASIQGYVANSNVSGTAGSARHGTWKIRIPVEAYDEFLNAMEQLGELQSLSTDSQDVTAEFFDLEARIHNKQQEEARLLKHLEQSTGKLDEILNVERELSRVREEVERMQGRRNLLQDLTAMTTVTLQLSEMRNFVPAVTPTLAGRVSRSFVASLDALRTAATELLLVLVVISPWLAVGGPVALFAWGVKRALVRKPLRTAATHV